ncbi:hypothetical protein HMPREF0602_1623 [Neisseria meningitidis ATCC 13091]|uniref:Uncharacterized protein n=1 Tax=Neisseria meningitidis serogroup B (strain ATCC 13091 / M2091) TaxID=862513 RepID=E0NAU1_NEIM3|nr:hypothetical protein [Neisseria meningitidis]EFM03891.1 hypothetical protein HMPREF0602_1623 [Neisseria meningitidis ATCC 13091]
MPLFAAAAAQPAMAWAILWVVYRCQPSLLIILRMITPFDG